MGFPGPLGMLKVGLLPTPRHLALQTALHLRARQNFQDLRGVTRKTGEEWLVTVQDTEAHVPDVHEEVLGVVPITTLGPRNYCVILDPVGQDGKNQLGQKRVVKVSASAPPPEATCPRTARGSWTSVPFLLPATCIFWKRHACPGSCACAHLVPALRHAA